LAGGSCIISTRPLYLETFKIPVLLSIVDGFNDILYIVSREINGNRSV